MELIVQRAQTVGVFFLLLTMLVYLGMPVLIRLTLKQAAQPLPIPFSLDDVNLPKQDSRDFQMVIDELQPAGFEPVAGLTLPSQTANATVITVLLANRQAKDVAMATVMYAKTADEQRRAISYVGISSRFRCGTVVHTSNSDEMGVFADRPTHRSFRLPMVKDAGRLYRLHQKLVARAELRDKVFRLDEEFGGNAAGYMTMSMIEELQDAARAGYMALYPDEEVYRATWKGAFLMTWKLLWPMKAIRKAARDRRAREIIAELEG